jgi:hypothetical protein
MLTQRDLDILPERVREVYARLVRTSPDWEARDVPSAGWELHARLRSWEDRVLRFFNAPRTPSITVRFVERDGLQLDANVGYEEWCQFPAAGWEDELRGNMEFIGGSQRDVAMLLELVAWLVNDHAKLEMYCGNCRFRREPRDAGRCANCHGSDHQTDSATNNWEPGRHDGDPEDEE